MPFRRFKDPDREILRTYRDMRNHRRLSYLWVPMWAICIDVLIFLVMVLDGASVTAIMISAVVGIVLIIGTLILQVSLSPRGNRLTVLLVLAGIFGVAVGLLFLWDFLVFRL